MRFTFCPHCGAKLTPRPIGDEGLVPYCDSCQIPLWEMFTTCIIAAVVNENREIALLRQNYISATKYVCLSGIMKPGETAEETAIREIKEEIGLDVSALEYVSSYYYEKKGMLMLGFRATVEKADFHISREVDSVQWVPLREAPEKLREGSIAWQLVTAVTEKEITGRRTE